MIIAIGADHRGFAHKEFLKKTITFNNTLVSWLDVGTHKVERTDYPQYAVAVCDAIRTNKAHRGILVCASGSGMAIAANRFKGIYAAVLWNTDVTRMSTQDDHINLLVIPSDFVGLHTMLDIVNVWCATVGKEGRYRERIEQIDALGGV